VNIEITTGSVYDASDFVIIRAIRNSFQETKKSKIATATSPGLANGMIILIRDCNLVHPSTLADSSRSDGMLSKNDVSIRILYGSNIAVYKIINAIRVSISFKKFIIKYIGIITLVTGNILIAMVNTKSLLLPRNFILANVYADKEVKKIAITVDKAETTKLLIVDLPTYLIPGGTFIAYAPLGCIMLKSLR
jgi:hypothetical protein